MDPEALAWVRDSITTDKLPKDVLTPGFLDYLRRRNKTS